MSSPTDATSNFLRSAFTCDVSQKELICWRCHLSVFILNTGTGKILFEFSYEAITDNESLCKYVN